MEDLWNAHSIFTIKFRVYYDHHHLNVTASTKVIGGVKELLSDLPLCVLSLVFSEITLVICEWQAWFSEAFSHTSSLQVMLFLMHTIH